MQVEQPSLGYPSIHGYRIGEEIGGGGFSKVFRAINDAEGQVAACKVVNLFISPSLGYGTPNVKELQKEVQVHKTLSGSSNGEKNRYILEFIHSEIVGQDQESQGYQPGLYMLLELAVGGDLFDKIAPDIGVPEDLAKFYFAQMASGIAFLHEKGIAHRDLKPENLLLAANGNLKISDFGLCAVYKHKGKQRLLSGRCGSLPYVAPELAVPTGYAAEPVDIWGMGVVLYTLLVGNTPWDEPSESSPEFSAYQTGEIFRYEPWTRIRGHAKAILTAMLTVDPHYRITMSGIMTHPWCMTPSQLSREELGAALVSGLKSEGMMAFANPAFTNASSQAYAAQRTQRMVSESQWGSQFNYQESQFLRATGNITQGGDFNNSTTRFWMNMPPEEALHLLHPFLISDLGEGNVVLSSNGMDLRVRKIAGKADIQGRFVIRANDALAESGQTLVVMKREKGSILHWRAFWWSLVRDARLERYVIKGDA